ncbi:MAG: DEAD/DEAH box helicase, partial [Candidatus Cloacimonadota bacterium]|nr:DEAD/DEAH box helicase [Candidatus Cloacimonadota bacterium]
IMRNDIQILSKKKFLYLILDESQKIKNTATKISKAVMLLNGKHRLALSGTPIENNLRELYSLFRFLNPAMFGSLKEFDKYYTIPIQKNNDETVMNELRRKIYPFILRRLKKDVAKDLPPKMEQTLYIEMDSAQKKYYEQRRAFFVESIKSQVGKNGIKKSQFFIFQALSELRQIATMPELKNESLKSSAKKEMLIEQIQDVSAIGHKALVFSNYVGTLEIISEELNKAGIEHLVMTGSTRDRKTLVQRFQDDNEIKVFLMTLKTGGVGLNLTKADYVYLLDPWWNVAAENQAVDRTHRIGQKKTVFSYKMITKDTIEEKILLLQQKKAELFDNIISSDGASVKFLSESDIDYLLS